MKIDLIAIAAHPDDAELAVAGTLIKHKALGYTTGIIDLTRGELGTRGTPELRTQEALDSSAIMGLNARVQLNIPDGFIETNQENLIPLIEKIRLYQPDIVLINAPMDRHPDHAKGNLIAKDACFLSGLRKIETFHEGKIQAPWRPKKVLQYIQDMYLAPDIVMDVTNEYESKIKAIKAFKSQFYNPESNEPISYIATEHFLRQLESRAIEMGKLIGVQYGEGLINTTQKVGLNSLFDQILPQIT
jgi:bacillithiol biosynthesis deacetylase BshB1